MSAGPPIEVLFFAANPADTDRLRLGEEVREIKEALRGATDRARFAVVETHAARPGDLTQVLLDRLRDGPPAVVHFSGHGGGAAGLALEDDRGQTAHVPADVLAALFAQFEGRIRCVLLNACYSQDQATAIVGHVPFVVGMRQAV